MKRFIIVSIILSLSPLLYAQFGWQSVGGIEILTHPSPPPDPPGTYAWPTNWGQDPGIPGYWAYGADNKYIFPLDNGLRYAELRVDNSIASGDAYITQTWTTTGDIPSDRHAQQFAAYALPTGGATGIWIEISFDTSPTVSRSDFAAISDWETDYLSINVPVVAHSYTLRIGVNKDPAVTTGTRSVLIDRCIIWDYWIFEPEWINWDFETSHNPLENRCLVTSMQIPLPTLSEFEGTTATYQIELSTFEDSFPPQENVLVTVDPNNQLSVNGNPAGDPIVLTFTTTEPNLPQTVTVTAYDDELEEGPHSGSIVHSSTSGDPNYDGLIIRSLTYPIDDDDLLGVSISETDSNTAVTEGKYSDTYGIVLLGTVHGGSAVLTVTPNPQLKLNDAVAGSPIDLTFTNTDWDTPQTVTVAAIHNPDVYGKRTVSISHSITGGGYDGVQIPDLLVEVGESGPYCGEAEQQYNTTDYNYDCYVNLEDFAELNLQSPQSVDMNEVAALSMQWLDCMDRNDPECIFWSRLDYMNPNAPSITEPEYPGTYYADLVPDTLDLAERCRLAVHGLTETTDPDYDYELYWIVDLLAETPAMYHTPDDHVQTKFIQALPLCRTACGSDENLNIERAILQVYLQMQGPDGLIYLPINGRAWALNGANPWGGLDYLPTGDYWCSLCTTGRTLGAFCVYHLKDPNGPWADAANALVSGFDSVIIEHADTAYFYQNCHEPGHAVFDHGAPTGFRAGANAWAAQGLAQAYRVLGNTRARDLALKMMTHIFRDGQYFGPNGEFLEDFPNTIHFHAHTNSIMGALEVVQATGNAYLLNRAIQAYNYAIANGNSTIGFFPEWLPNSATSEICEVADMITCAVKLSQLGYDKWDDVDRWVRNQFAECQLTNIEWLTDGSFTPIVRTGPVCGAGMMCGYPEYGTTNHVAERAIGTFSGWPTANDFIGSGGFSIMHCCTGNATRALYYVWKNILNYDNDTLSINLLLNRASQWADLDSYIPSEGRIDLNIKQNLNLEVRVPEWTVTGDITCTVNGSPRSLTFNGRYAQIGSVNSSDTVVVQFPLPEVTEVISAGGGSYTITRRGNSVINISPGGTNCPLYQDGDRFQTGVAEWVSRQRFVPDEEIDW